MNVWEKVVGFCLCLLLFGWLFFHNQTSQIKIDFEQTEPIPGYQIKNKDMPLRIAMISVLNHEDTAKYQKQIAEKIGQELGRSVLLLHRKSYTEINQLLSKKNADIAFLSSGAYLIYGQKDDFILLAMQEKNNANYYYAYIIASDTSGVQSLEDLKGKKFAYVDPLSYSGYLILQQKLTECGENPERYFQSYYFTYSHDASLQAVINGLVDGAVIASLTYDYYQKFKPEELNKVKVVKVLPPSGTGPVVARKNLDNVEKIQDVLLHLHEDLAIKSAMENLMIDRFVPPQPDLYPHFLQGGR